MLETAECTPERILESALDVHLQADVAWIVKEYIGSIVVETQELEKECQGLLWSNGMLFVGEFQAWSDPSWKCTFWKQRRKVPLTSIPTGESPSLRSHGGWSLASHTLDHVASIDTTTVTLFREGGALIDDGRTQQTFVESDYPISQFFFGKPGRERLVAYFSDSQDNLICVRARVGQFRASCKRYHEVPNWTRWCVVGDKVVMCSTDDTSFVNVIEVLHGGSERYRIHLDASGFFPSICYCIGDDDYVYLASWSRLWKLKIFLK